MRAPSGGDNSDRTARRGAAGEQARRRLTGAGAGLTTSRLARDILARDLGLDHAAYAPVLGLTPRSLDDAVRATVAASLA